MIIEIIIVVILIVGLGLLFLYNNLIRKKNAVENSFHTIDIMLKKRYDLIPRLVETVKGYMNYEKDILQQLTELRAQAISGKPGTNERVQLDNSISSGLQKIIVSVEKYPDLKASASFLNLQGSLNETEEQLAASRRYYNAAVTDYHNAIETFPSSMMASWMGLKHKNLFEVTEAEREGSHLQFKDIQ